MKNRRLIILNSVKKLLKLGISNAEIVLHLEEVGIEETEAREIIAEAKGLGPSPIPANSSGVLHEVKEDFKETPAEKKEESSFFQNPEQEPEEPEPDFKRHFEPVPAANLADLWEKGILKTVTNKLQEMKQLKDQIDSTIDDKIESALRKEIKKTDALIESKQTLLLAKMNSSLDTKAKEVSELIEEKIKQLKKMKEEKEMASSSLSIKKDMAKETFEKLSDELEKTVKERQQSLQAFNSELIKAKGHFEETIEDARQKLVALEERATQTLELETSIIDGMIKESQNRIDRITIEKMDDLTKDVREALTELEALKVGINVEEVNQKILEIKQVKETLDRKMESAVEAVAKNIEERIEKELKTRLRELDKEYQQIVKNVSVEIIQNDMKEIKSLKKELQKELSKLKKN